MIHTEKYRRHSWFSFIRIRRNFIFHRHRNWKHERRLLLCVTYWSLMNSEQILHSKLNQLFWSWFVLVQLILNVTFWSHHVKFCFFLVFCFLDDSFVLDVKHWVWWWWWWWWWCHLTAVCIHSCVWADLRSVCWTAAVSLWCFGLLCLVNTETVEEEEDEDEDEDMSLHLSSGCAALASSAGVDLVVWRFIQSSLITFVVMTKRLIQETGSDTCLWIFCREKCWFG